MTDQPKPTLKPLWYHMCFAVLSVVTLIYLHAAGVIGNAGLVIALSSQFGGQGVFEAIRQKRVGKKGKPGQ